MSDLVQFMSIGIGLGMVLKWAVDGIASAWWQFDELVASI